MTGATDDVPLEVQLAIGRLLRMLSRPYKPGDDETFEACRSIILDASPPPVDHRPNWARDRLKGAQGD